MKSEKQCLHEISKKWSVARSEMIDNECMNKVMIVWLQKMIDNEVSMFYEP